MHILKLRRSSALLCLAVTMLFRADADGATVSAPGITVTSASNGRIQVKDSSGIERMRFEGLRFQIGAGSLAAETGTAASTTINGHPALRVNYTVTGGAAAVVGQFTPMNNGRLKIHFTISATQTPTNAKMLRSSLPFAPDGVTLERKVVETGLWTRPANGRTPYEEPDFHGLEYSFPVAGLKALLQGPTGSGDDWNSPISLTQISGGQWTADALFSFVPASVRLNSYASVFAPRALGLDVWSAWPYNIWEPSSSPLPITAQAYNNSSNAKALTLSWWARDFSGNIVEQGSAQKSVAALAHWNHSIGIPAAGSRGIFFVEVSVTDGTETVFARTNLAVLPPFEFQSAPGSLFGLSVTFKLPDKATELALLQRMGVRSLRREVYTAAEVQAAGIVQFAHNGVRDSGADWTEGRVSDTRIDSYLGNAADISAPSWEAGNEMNLLSFPAATYVNNLLIPARNRASQRYPNIKIMLGGIAGKDPGYLADLYAAGGWPYLDVFALHAGRGNYTPDLDGDGWKFISTIRKTKEILAQYGGGTNGGPKPLYITEAYACTMPGSTWDDTIRHAAENVVLSYALAKAEGVKVMHWYQLNDGTGYHIGEVDPRDKEYHFGLLNRDLSPKPSLLGYRAIAEALDLAEFEHEMIFADPKVHGLMFSNPYGSVSVLWDRTDGYVFDNLPATSEPWIDDWSTHKSVTVHTGGTSLGLPYPIYLQPFENPGLGEINVSAKSGWTVYNAGTGAITTAPKIQSGGAIYSSVPANGGFVFAGTDTGTITLENGRDISLDTIASSNIARVQLLLRMNNGQWYASNTVLTPETASSWRYAHDPQNGVTYRKSIQFTRTASAWSSFNLTSGSPMGVGAALTSNLPSGTITGIGWYVRNIHSSWGVTARFDNIDLPAINVLDSIGRPVAIGSKNRQATLTLSGAPSIVYGLEPNGGNVTTMDTDDAGVTVFGAWTTADATGPFLGQNYLHDGNTGKGTKSVQYVPNLSAAGTYRVEAFWTPSSNRSAAVPYTITHAGGTATVTRNQQEGGTWTALGTYTFDQGTAGKVKVSNTGTSGYVVADGIRFVSQ